jgi:hypothetical protein
MVRRRSGGALALSGTPSRTMQMNTPILRDGAEEAPPQDEVLFNDRRKHFAGVIIPVLPCKTPAVFVAAMCFPSTPRRDTN